MGPKEPVDNFLETELEKNPVNIKMPSKYKVILINDDYTPMDFVVLVLQNFFSMAYEYAVQVMLDVHLEGKAVCGIYTRDIAQTKVVQVNEYAKEHQHPLKCIMQECD